MTGEIPNYEGGCPEIDPIKDVFIEDGLRELLTPATYVDTAASVVGLVNRGILSAQYASFILGPRTIEPESTRLDFGEALDIVGHVDPGSDTFSDRYYCAYFEHADATGGKEDFVPMRYYQDGGRKKSGISLEEWRELPESARDTLRDDRFLGH